MSSIAGILIGHGQIPQALNKAIQNLIGTPDDFQIVSNENCSASELRNHLEKAIKNLGTQDTIIFVDLYGGSCANISKQILKDERPTNIGIICGVNLGILIKYFQHRDKLNFQDLIKLLEETGKNEIKVVTS